MNKVFVVKVRSWDESFSMKDFSFHQTREGAEKAVEEAKKKFCTETAWIQEFKVKE